MAFLDCLKSAADQGEINAAEAARLKGLYEALLRQHQDDSPAAAPFAAKQALSEMLAAAGLEEKRRLALTLKATNRLWRDVAGFRRTTLKGVSTADIGEAALHTIEHFGTAPFSSVEGRKRAIVGQAHMRLEALLHTFRRNAVSGDRFRHGRAHLDNVVRESFGKGTGDEAAKGLTQAWLETAEWLRRRYNAAGGHIAKLENWGLPQAHDARALRRAGLATWKAEIRGRLDLARMRHPLSGRRVTAEDLDDLLDHVFASVTQEGWNTREAARRPFGLAALANRNAEHRFLVFKSADDWLAYQKGFGEGDPFAAMMGYVNRMARDVAAMEILGPNPHATVEWLTQAIEKEGQKAAAGEAALLPKTGRKGLDHARRKIDRLARMWAAYTGEMETPVAGRAADVMAVGRNWVTASVLGAATLSSVGDLGTQQIARSFAGIPQARMVAEIARGFSNAGKREAVEAGLILEAAMHTFHRQARYVGSLGGPEFSQYLADRVLTWSGLTPWTQAGRHAFGLAFMRTAAAAAGRRFGALDPAFAATLTRWGFTAADWERLRGAAVDGGDGLRLLRAKEIAAADAGLADRWLEMIAGETEHAVPTGSLRARTALVSQDQPGTLWGELTRSFAQFKSFATVFAFLSAMRYVPMIAARDGAVRARGAGYAGALLISTTVFGALALQLKQIAAGRDPRNMADRRFWGAALLQGGGLGIFGDFLFADVNRFGGGFPATLAGPTVEHVWDLWTLTGGNLIELAEGQDTRAGREAVNFVRGNVPFSTLWYLRLGWERLVLDQLQYLADPQANAAFKRKQQWWRRETGQEFWWAPGEAAPRRAPAAGALWR